MDSGNANESYINKNRIELSPQPSALIAMGINSLKLEVVYIYEREKKIELIGTLAAYKYMDDIVKFEEIFKQKNGGDITFHWKLQSMEKEISQLDLKTILEKLVEKIKIDNAISRSFLYKYRIVMEDSNIFIEVKSEMAERKLHKFGILMQLNDMLAAYGISQFKVRLRVGDFTKELAEVSNQMIKLEETLVEEHDKLLATGGNGADEGTGSNSNLPGKRDRELKKLAASESKGIVYGREIKGKPITFEDLEMAYDGENIVIEGEVFSIVQKETRTGKIIFTFGITNLENSITCKFFIEKEKFELHDIKNKIKVGSWFKVGGRKQRDAYNNDEEFLMLSSINIIESKRNMRKDNYETKRVELHAHTKMSEMVGSIDAKELVGRALEYGHKAVAITDYGVAHAFPFAYKAAKGKDIKVIFGVEAYMVDETRPMVENAKEIALLDETYVVFDLETCGLNAHEHEIIEIGAIKMRGMDIIDRYTQLINPGNGKKIPKNIQELTNITDAMVANEPTIEEVLPKFMEFVGEATLVAHNAKFDMGFLKRDLLEHMGLDYNPAVIDTLQWGRDIMPDLRGHGLKSLVKEVGKVNPDIKLINHHRAVDDSQATAHVFKRFLELYIKEGAVNLHELDGVFPVNYEKRATNNVMILVKNQTGLKNLYKIISDAHIEHYGMKKPRITRKLLMDNREGLLVGAPSTLHYGNEGELVSSYIRGSKEAIPSIIDFYDYIELQPRSSYNDQIERQGTGAISSHEMVETMNRYLYSLAKEHNKMIVATSNVHYMEPEEAIIRSILLYGSGSVFRTNQYATDNKLYFRTTDEMVTEFIYFGEEIAHELVITTPSSISEMIEEVQPVPSGFYPPKIDNAEDIVREMTYSKAHRIYGNPLPEIVESRIKRELDAIIGNGFAVLYLSAQKLVKESLDNGYLVGSRGSVGSSLVAYMMDITEVNALYPHYICDDEQCKHSEFLDKEGAGVDIPIKNCPKCGKEMRRDGHAIPFEVFMGFNGDKVPDIDLNFSGEYQGNIHRYCEELFGKENVFKAGTISTLAEKNAYGYVKKYFDEHREENGRLVQDKTEDPMKKPMKSSEITRLAQKVEGAKKTTGQHPGGMIVVPQGHSIYEFTPVQRPANDKSNPSTTTHFDYHVMDEQLVKLDILGHDDPTTIKMLQDYTGVDIYDVPLNDPQTLSLFSSTEALGVKPEEIGSKTGTFGVPEFGTGFVRQMLEQTNPSTFAELVRISGLSHGTDVWLNNAQEFIKEGNATLMDVISVRDDIMNYLIDSGVDKGTAFQIMEFVRKGKPSSDPEKWEEYSKLMKEHSVDEWYIESCKRIKYMFPKGHAVAYVMMAMRIAYFKVHYPVAFYAAYLSRKAGDFDSDFMMDLGSIRNKIRELGSVGKLDARQKGQLALSEILQEMNARGYKFLDIDLYKSDGFKFIIEDGLIRPPLVALNGLGGAVIEKVVEERVGAKFLSYEDLRRRTGVNKTTVEKMKKLNIIEGLQDTNQKSLF